jgi:hypothetical protein
LEETIRKTQRNSLSEETFEEKAAKARMGKCLTHTETCFVSDPIDPLQPHAIMDVGSGAGKFSLLATE